MQTAQMQWLPRIGWRPTDFSDAKWKPDVVFAFGSRNVLSDAGCMDALRDGISGGPAPRMFDGRGDLRDDGAGRHPLRDGGSLRSHAGSFRARGGVGSVASSGGGARHRQGARPRTAGERVRAQRRPQRSRAGSHRRPARGVSAGRRRHGRHGRGRLRILPDPGPVGAGGREQHDRRRRVLRNAPQGRIWHRRRVGSLRPLPSRDAGQLEMCFTSSTENRRSPSTSGISASTRRACRAPPSSFRSR